MSRSTSGYALKLKNNAMSAMLIAMLLSACTTHHPSKMNASSFTTRISSSGLKHFEYRPQSEVYKQANSVTDHRRAQQKSRTKAPKRQYEKLESTLEKKAKKIIENNQYCREAFLILDVDRDLKGPYLRGECYETASEQDRAQFPDTIINW